MISAPKFVTVVEFIGRSVGNKPYYYSGLV